MKKIILILALIIGNVALAHSDEKIGVFAGSREEAERDFQFNRKVVTEYEYEYEEEDTIYNKKYETTYVCTTYNAYTGTYGSASNVSLSRSREHSYLKCLQNKSPEGCKKQEPQCHEDQALQIRY